MKRRPSKHRRAVAVVLLARPDAKHWGYAVTRAARLYTAQVYPVLRAMERDGWLTSAWEDQATVQGRSVRRYYQLTDLGRVELAALVAIIPARPNRNDSMTRALHYPHL